MAKLINTKFRVSTQGATKAILPGLARDFNRIFKRNQKSFEAAARVIIKQHIQDHKTYKSLFDFTPNSLRSEFGLEDPQGQVRPIIDHWLDSIRVDIDPVKASGTRLSGGITVVGIRASFQDAVFLPTASFIAERAQKQNIIPFEIAWLEWLLLKGEQALVFGFFVDASLKSTDNSRTGISVMRAESTVRFQGVDWGVSSEYAGTQEDNWITQSVADAIDEVRDHILDRILPQLGAVQRIR